MSIEYELALLDDSTHPTKTIDFGHDGISSSLSKHGRFLSLAASHPIHGQVIAEPYEQFDPTRHEDQTFVRRYRARAISIHDTEKAGFGLSLFASAAGGSRQRLTPHSWHFVNGSWPRIRFASETCKATVTYYVESGRVVQQVELENPGAHAIEVDAELSGDISINRAAYTQLTPKGDCSIPEPKNVVSQDQRGNLIIDNPILPARLQLNTEGECKDWSGELPVERESRGTLKLFRNATIFIPAGSTKSFSIDGTLSIGTSQEAPRPLSRTATLSSITSLIDIQSLISLLDGDHDLTYIVIRNLDYLLSCCTLPVISLTGASKGTCIITDHQCLPLGWNRDNYWQLDLISAILYHADSIIPSQHVPIFKSSLVDTIGSHLCWVFRTAKRPVGFWARSYFATGIPKDEVFQLDQQCYPLLELAQFARRYPEHIDLVRELCAVNVDEILDCLRQHRWEGTGGEDGRLWLFRTDETPADDEVDFPYHFSSHILLWYTLKELTILRETLGGDIIRTPVGNWAEEVYADTRKHFTVEDPANGLIFAYLVSTAGEYQLYHDANDLPTALAPRWGFCPASDPIWQNTIRFAFCPSNTGGWYPGGRFGGLGSIHTPDPWPLGHAQGLWINSYGEQLVEPRAETVKKLKAEVQWDGMFSEAIDRHTGQVTSKSWFSWPGAFISSTLLWQKSEAIM